MYKILYAASNTENAKIQLARFMTAMKQSSHTIKIAAFKQSSPKGINIDWTLDSLLNIFKPDHISLDNENFEFYFEQVKYYAPDLIISDLEYFTSYIANVLNITLWQCSSSLINLALSHHDKYNLGLFKTYSYLHNQRIANIIDNSNCNFVYSHFGDLENPPTLNNNFEWIRPYFQVGKKSIPCQHNIVAAALKTNKQMVSLLKSYTDSILFCDFIDEDYSNPVLKNINNVEEYFCNLHNSNVFCCEGQTNFLADAFYNNKFSLVLTNFKDLECITNSMFSQHFGLSVNIFSNSIDLEQFSDRTVTTSLKDDIKYLHEKIEDL
jgi:hypothetical protein